jgi:hypothetical protein
MADALGLGPSGAIRGGSSPFSRTNFTFGVELRGEAETAFVPVEFQSAIDLSCFNR